MSIRSFPKTELEAKALGERLAQELRDTLGGDWSYDVGFNSWWYYHATLGDMVVSEYNYNDDVVTGSLSYGFGFKAGTPMFLYNEKEYKGSTPKEAVEKAMAYVKKRMEHYNSFVDTNTELLK